MKRVLFALTLTASLFMAGCASSPTGASRTQAADAASTPRIAAAVPVPAVSTRKLVLAMSGPKSIVESKDWSELKREWRDTFSDHAKAAGIAYTFSDAEPKPTGEDGTILLVDVADYRIVGIGARVLFGAMTGNAYINAKVKFASLRDGAPYGEQQYNTSSSAWGGVFAKVTPQQVDSIASNVFMDLKAAK